MLGRERLRFLSKEEWKEMFIYDKFRFIVDILTVLFFVGLGLGIIVTAIFGSQ